MKSARPRGVGLTIAVMALVQLALWGNTSDDAYISFRYVERWVDGHGLTFNPGEQIEGFSNPLWIGILAVSRLLLPALPIANAAAVLGFIASVVAVVAMALIVRRSNPDRYRPSFTYAAVILVCTPGFHVYTTSGLETPLLGALVTLAVLFSLSESYPARLRAAVYLGFAAVCRPEAPLYGLLWWLFMQGPQQLRAGPARESGRETRGPLGDRHRRAGRRSVADP